MTSPINRSGSTASTPPTGRVSSNNNSTPPVKPTATVDPTGTLKGLASIGANGDRTRRYSVPNPLGEHLEWATSQLREGMSINRVANAVAKRLGVPSAHVAGEIEKLSTKLERETELKRVEDDLRFFGQKFSEVIEHAELRLGRKLEPDELAHLKEVSDNVTRAGGPWQHHLAPRAWDLIQRSRLPPHELFGQLRLHPGDEEGHAMVIDMHRLFHEPAATVQASKTFNPIGRAAERASVERTLGGHLNDCLGGVNPLDVATPHQQERMLSAIKELRIKAELVVVDEHGQLSESDKAVFDQVYATNFPASEAVPIDTIAAARANRQKAGTHLDGKRFTLCLTGVPPGGHEDERRPLAFAQGGALDAGPKGMVAYAEYWAVNEDLRGRGALHVLQAYTDAVGKAAVEKHNQATGDKKLFLGGYWEKDPTGRGETPKDRVYSIERNQIYERTGAQTIMGRDSAGQLLPVHAQPDVTPTGDCGNWHLDVVFRPQKPEYVGLVDREAVAALSRSYSEYFQDWADTGLPGVDSTKIAAAAAYREALHERIHDIALMPPTQGPGDCAMAHVDPLVAKIVADDFGLRTPGGRPYEESDCMDAAVRRHVANLAERAFAQEVAQHQAAAA